MKDRLKYKYALNKDGDIVNASTLSKQIKLYENNEFYVEGNLENGDKALLPVMAVIGSKVRSHFRAFTDPKKQVVGFIHNKEHFGEVVLHKLGKKVVASMKNIVLPRCEYSTETNKFTVSKTRAVRVSKAEIEKYFMTCTGGIRYDVFITTDAGEELGIEILVTHTVDSSKQSKSIELGHEMLELDLSDLIDKVDKVDIEDEIVKRLVSGDGLTWIVNKQYGKIKRWINGQVRMSINRAEYTQHIDGPKDEAWFVWAADYTKSIPNCPYINTLLNSENTFITRDKYLESNQCINCGRCTVISNDKTAPPKSTCGTMLCNQSDVSNQEIFSIVTQSLCGYN